MIFHHERDDVLDGAGGISGSSACACKHQQAQDAEADTGHIGSKNQQLARSIFDLHVYIYDFRPILNCHFCSPLPLAT
jgi:hypothetical protein